MCHRLDMPSQHRSTERERSARTRTPYSAVDLMWNDGRRIEAAGHGFRVPRRQARCRNEKCHSEAILNGRGSTRAGRSVSNAVAASALIGSPNAKPCANSQPRW